MREIHGADVFVTLTGQKTEQALGWLTDDLLKGVTAGWPGGRRQFFA